MRVGLAAAVVSLVALACAVPGQPGPATAPPNEPAPTSVAATTEAPPTAASTGTGAPAAPDVATLPEPTSVRWAEVVGGLTQPLDLQHAGDDRLFVVEQPGVIRLIADGEVQAEPFLDLRDRVVDDALEQGLLGLAFDPAYEQNGYFYVNYTGAGGHTRISRFRVSQEPNRADPASEQILLGFDQPYRNHNGGGLAFGPDGYLYIGVGDGGSAGDPQNNAQNLGTLLGSLLRIDVHGEAPYGLPPDNPFVNRPDARDEIWDYGLRNPWRFSFDPATGGLYIADVGQNQWEEINFEPADSPGGINYGWNYLEGSHPYEGGGEGTVLPVAEYNHDLGCSVTGGVVVRDPALPEWQGVYLYGDYCSGNVWGLVREGQTTWISQRLFTTNYQVSAFGTDSGGRVYLVDLMGDVYRMTPAE